MAFKRITENDMLGKGNVGKPDTPGVSTSEMQRIMDELPREVIAPAFNELSGQLEANTASADIGANAPDGITPDPAPAENSPAKLQSVLQGIVNKITDHIADQVKHVTSEERTLWNNASNDRHTHDNKSILDGITSSLVGNWNAAFAHISDAVRHITENERTNWNDKYTKSETDKAINERVVEIGSSDMTKAVYDPETRNLPYIPKIDAEALTLGKNVVLSGSPVSIAYAGANRIDALTLYGENVQGGTTEAPVALTGVDSVQVCGNNLLPMATETKTIYGVTFTPNSNGSITVSGTATGGIATYNFADGLDRAMLDQTVFVSGAIQLVKVIINEKTAEGAFARNVIVDRGQGASGILTKQKDSNILYATLQVQNGDTVNHTIYPMLNLGSTAMPYEPYQGSVTTLPIPRPLRKVGDVRDVCRTRVKSVYDKRIVLDGTENWNISSSKPNSFLTPVSERIVNGLSDSYPTLKSPEIGTKNGIYLNYTADIIVTDLACSTVEEFKAHLSAHPLTVYYRSTAYDGTNGLDVCLTEYMTGYIESYADESITTAWISSTGALSTGAEVAYVLNSPETYATDPLDIDNAAGPLTVMTGGEVEVRMTELIGSRSPEFAGKMDRDIYFQVGNLNLGDNTNLLNPVNQQGQASYTGDSTSPYCIDRWRISNGTTYNIVSRTLTASSYANRACGMWQTNELAQQALAIGSTITFSGYINGMQHSGTIKILNRDLYSSFAEVPAGYECDDFEIVCCTASHEQSKYNLGIYPKKEAVLNWIKWEKGLYATPYAPKGFGLEQLECMRYYQTIKGIKYVLRKALASEGFPYVIPVTFMPMRAVPQTDITVTEGAENNLTATGVTQTACGIQFQPVAENVGLTFTLTLSANL